MPVPKQAAELVTQQAAVPSAVDMASQRGVPRAKFRGPFALKREGGWLTHLWYGMRFGTWIKLLRRGRCDFTLNCLPSVLAITVVTPVNSLLYYLSELRHGRAARAARIDPAPVFIIGHWRSGTTLLHELLACDPAHACPTTSQCAFPSHFLLTDRVVRKWLKVFLPKRRPMDRVVMGMDRPQEEEFALANLGSHTPYTTMAWPRQGVKDEAYLDLLTLDADARAAWEQDYLWFLRRVACKSAGRRLILKSPAHTARLRTLIKLFPDARFIHLARDPLKVIPSTRKLWKSLNSVQGLQNPAEDDPWVDDFVFDAFDRLFDRYEQDKHLVPEGQLIEITYEQLVADPVEALKKIYAKTGLGDFARVEPAARAYWEKHRDLPVNEFQLTGEQREQILRRCAGYCRRFGYHQSG
jgi:hypothetical protein